MPMIVMSVVVLELAQRCHLVPQADNEKLRTTSTAMGPMKSQTWQLRTFAHVMTAKHSATHLRTSLPRHDVHAKQANFRTHAILN